MLVSELHAIHGNRGSGNSNAKLNEISVSQIKAQIRAGRDKRAIAADYGVKPCTIKAINQGRLWRHVK